MKRNKKINFISLSFLFYILACCKNPGKSNDYLLLFNDTATNGFGYKNQLGAIIIPQGKYQFCFTDTFKTYAIVSKPNDGVVAIDRHEKILYNIFSFDNGPDYPSQGLFRIIANNKIGFADAATGEIVIKSQFDCAYPFEDGRAKVSTECKTQDDGEHSEWLSNNWFYIDKKGNRIDK